MIKSVMCPDLASSFFFFNRWVQELRLMELQNLEQKW